MFGPIPILKIGDILIASVQVDLKDTVVDAFQKDLLNSIQTQGARGLVIDISGVEALDTYVARMISNTSEMAKLMGAETVLVGMKAEVAATLTRMGYPFHRLRTALTLEHGLALLSQGLRKAG